MDFQKTSHLRSLIPAVLVGLLALAANQYAKMDPKSLNESMKSFEEHVTNLVKLDKEPESPLDVQKAALKEIHKRVSEEFTKWQRQRHRVDEKQLGTAVAEADHIYDFLDQNPQLPEDERRSCRLTQLIVHFMAAEMQPEVYSEGFLEI